MKKQMNVRTSNLTRQQIDELVEYLHDTEGAIVATAIDRMWHEEVPLAKRHSKVLETGDLIGISPASNTHGCRDFAVIRYAGSRKGTVIEAASCTSCWQVGHDGDHVFATVGDTWDVNPAEVSLAGETWSRTIKWQM